LQKSQIFSFRPTDFLGGGGKGIATGSPVLNLNQQPTVLKTYKLQSLSIMSGMMLDKSLDSVRNFLAKARQ
jgi:hypothetical protein